MLSYIDSAVSIQSLIWLFLAAFMLHDFEEIIRMENWFRKAGRTVILKVPQPFDKIVSSASQITTAQFAFAVCVEFMVFVPVTYLAAEHNHYLLFIGFNAVLLLHVFMHIGQALFVRMLVPGVTTAVLITLPYTLYLFYRLLSEHLIQWSDLIRAC
ncbi:HXXEE domain-containing protein [Paenibacillus sp. 32O-W]|uniref:HXXEE domain-containing protein n=1 Tax=Paenibacillus sp. 32O-W TaxID=1695218 RepID=UPI00119EA210|nr:HXXEE domain-containing protein [Paenibacillus sp. 32O-W]